MRRLTIIAPFFALLGAMGWVGCGGGASGGGGGDTTGCPSEMGGSRAGAVPAHGGVTGPSVRAAFCPDGEFAVLENGEGATPDPFLFHLDTGTSPVGTSYPFTMFQDPANTASGNIEAIMGVPAGRPGTYSDANGACGLVSVCAYVISTGSDCEDAGTSTCSTAWCYQALGAKSCDPTRTGSQPPQGSWTLTLTSIAPYAAGGLTTPDSTVHGSLMATLVGVAPSVGTATLSVTF